MTARCIVPLAIVAIAGCRVAPATLPEAPRDAATSRAALATLVVDNRSERTVAIGYEYLESGGGAVVIGRVAPASIDTMPPVPAREPIVLFARDSLGAVLRGTPQVLEIDTVFIWQIPARATFSPPEP
jgi:hypothetical protein